ncbi:solute carrier family 22 member 6-A isoform X3 [Callorhinchus milii]|nr:solute carrier family 22 member 6-A isoform X3 [Callorhinchus milii]|eukprot:gi/632986037/ref/XP_007910016.1/ PREDICTED: solute carrier family 22 member 20 isoform X3 [Callorhinchus milii]
MGFTDLLEMVGSTGRFQMVHVTLLALPVLMMASHNLLQNFVAAVPDHRCRIRADALGNASRQSPGNVTGEVPAEELLLPVFIPLDREGRPERCRLFAEPQWQFLDPNRTHEDGSSTTRPCTNGWLYSHGDVTSTIISEWDLVCDQRSLKQMSQSIYMSGVLVGAIVMGQMSDRFGRRPILLWSHLQLAITGTCGSFSSSFPLFCFWRFMCGVAVSGLILNSFSLTVEWIPTKVRTSVATLNNYSYTIGQFLLVGLAYALRNWRWLQFAVSAPFFIYFLYSWWFPESARWLIMNDKADVAVNQLKRVARLNGREAEGSKLTAAIVKSHMEKELSKCKTGYSVTDLFHTPVMRRTACCTMVVWFSVSFAYYGLSIDLQGFGVNIYLIQMIFAAVDIPAKLVGVATMSLIGRRFTQGSSLILAGTIIIINIFIPQEMSNLRTSFAAIGKGCLAASFSCAYLHAGELYPTVVRQTGMGLVSSMARIGSMVAPLVKMTGDYVSFLPMAIYGGVAVLAGIVAFFLRETLNIPLPESIEGVESSWKKKMQKESEPKNEEISLRETPPPSLMTQTI